MSIKRALIAAGFFVTGVAAGVLWSSLRAPTDDNVSSASGQNEQNVAKVREVFGEGAAKFVKQFEDLTIRIKKGPIDAQASPDGRFVIRLAGDNETIASELQFPDDTGPVNEVARHYAFSSGNRTYSCDFVRKIGDSSMPNVLFSITDADGRGLSYVDSDGDGRWDRFTDSTAESPRFYRRDGLCWKEKDVGKGAEEKEEEGKAAIKGEKTQVRY
jgi:hypothetical protein